MLRVKSQNSAVAPSENDSKNQGFGGAKPNQRCELCKLHDADKKLGKGINASMKRAGPKTGNLAEVVGAEKV
jgi:hypothetical protein